MSYANTLEMYICLRECGLCNNASVLLLVNVCVSSCMCSDLSYDKLLSVSPILFITPFKTFNNIIIVMLMGYHPLNFCSKEANTFSANWRKMG